MTNPSNALAVHPTRKDTICQDVDLRQKKVCVDQSGGRRGFDTGTRKVCVAHHHVAVAGEVAPQVVVPEVVVTVSVADHHQGSWVHVLDVGRVVHFLGVPSPPRVLELVGLVGARFMQIAHHRESWVIPAHHQVSRVEAAIEVKVIHDIESGGLGRADREWAIGCKGSIFLRAARGQPRLVPPRSGDVRQDGIIDPLGRALGVDHVHIVAEPHPVGMAS